MKMSKKNIAFIIISILAVVLIIFFVTGRKSIPTGKEGPEAENMARSIEEFVGFTAYRNLAAVSFTFSPAGNQHFRDLQRNFIEVQFETEAGTAKVQYDHQTRSFIAYLNEEVTAEQAAANLFEKAYEIHTSDYFWMNPFIQLNAPHSIRKKVDANNLLVTYTDSNGSSGDSYLIQIENGRPVSWKMWVEALPMKGMEVTFENWIEKDGIRIARERNSIHRNLEILNLELYENPEQPDRFAELQELVDTRG